METQVEYYKKEPGGEYIMSTLQRMCKSCGTITPVTPFMICDDCLHEREAVRTYLRHHPNATSIEIAQQTNVNIERISYLVHQGGLVYK